MKRLKPPFRMRIYGQLREVVRLDTMSWTERRPDGRLVTWPGRLLPAQEPGQILDEPKPCSVCKEPAITATARGRAHHMWCEKRWTILPDEQLAKIIHGVARDLGAQILDRPPRRRSTERTVVAVHWRGADRRRR